MFYKHNEIYFIIKSFFCKRIEYFKIKKIRTGRNWTLDAEFWRLPLYHWATVLNNFVQIISLILFWDIIYLNRLIASILHFPRMTQGKLAPVMVYHSKGNLPNWEGVVQQAGHLHVASFFAEANSLRFCGTFICCIQRLWDANLFMVSGLSSTEDSAVISYLDRLFLVNRISTSIESFGLHCVYKTLH